MTTTPPLNSAVYVGSMRHVRLEPRRHEFGYRLYQMYLDLGEVETLFDGRWLWSARGPALAWFRREDHFGDPDVPLAETVRNLVEERTGHRPAGPVRLLTNLRIAGVCFNPASFYWCFDRTGERVEAVVAEVHNTPWLERHAYVLRIRPEDGAGPWSIRHRKEMHVSPFLPMEMDYEFRLGPPGESVDIRIDNHRDGRSVFHAGMRLERREITGPNLARVLLRHPFMAGKVLAAIYWQALRLVLKGIPFHPHPSTLPGEESA